ncbi:MAG: thioredoxin family protein [Saprospiraceae bacterium]|nr:thioredoxin family protein [Saprospiraceae bacterium]
MKKIVLLISASVLAFSLSAQILTPVSWSTSYKQISETEFDLIFTATIDDDWVIYSQYLSGDDGPIPTHFYFDEGDHFEFVGKNKESGNKKEAFDNVFKMNLVKFYKKAIFTQRVKIKDFSKPIKGYLEFMTCDDQKCLPPTEEEFSFELVSTLTKKTEEKKEDKTSTIAGKEKAAKDLNTQPAEENIALQLNETPQSGGIFNPVKWTGEVKKISDTEFDLIFKAKVDDAWYIYSQLIGDDGPIPTEFDFIGNEHITVKEKAKEEGSQRIEGMDDIFGINVIKFKKEVTFTQRVQVSDVNKIAQGEIHYMSCNESSCIAFDEPFRADFANLTLGIGDEMSINTGVAASDNSGLYGDFPKPDLNNPVADCGETVEANEGKGFWAIFMLGFLGGFIALLTPCVFPMIPLTVSFFTKSSKDRKKGIANASFYGFSIFAVYLVLSIPFHLMDSINPDILNDISTNVWLNLSFFAIFMFFAFSFFGYYELTLPSSWANRVSNAEGIGGILGIFFMAVTLALVSFSCTGPILGSLLAGALSADGGAMQLTAGMGGFGLALALPFALFAAFPSWMSSLPKSGGWLNTVKVVLGFVELALALKFLSNADLVKHWEILKIEPFLGAWMLISIGLALYLFGIIKFPHDSPIKKLSITRIALGVASVAFAIYLATGFIYDEKAGSLKPLTLLSGMAPPACYSWFYPCDCPQNLNCFKDLKTGMAYAKEVGKPVMIDFTGHACVNCRKMEENVWPKPQVYNLLKDEYVLISLYGDEKIELPENEQIEVPKATGGTRVLRNVGHKWQHFSTEYFGTNTQPFYALISPDGQLLNYPVGYTPDANEYASFLQCGLDAYKQLTQNQQNTSKQIGSK